MTKDIIFYDDSEYHSLFPKCKKGLPGIWPWEGHLHQGVLQSSNPRIPALFFHAILQRKPITKHYSEDTEEEGAC